MKKIIISSTAVILFLSSFAGVYADTPTDHAEQNNENIETEAVDDEVILELEDSHEVLSDKDETQLQMEPIDPN